MLAVILFQFVEQNGLNFNWLRSGALTERQSDRGPLDTPGKIFAQLTNIAIRMKM